jgi:hypothetical protein
MSPSLFDDARSPHFASDPRALLSRRSSPAISEAIPFLLAQTPLNLSSEKTQLPQATSTETRELCTSIPLRIALLF